MAALDQPLITFQEAVDLVVRDAAQAAFAFKPDRRGRHIVGGIVYTVYHQDDEDGEEPPWRVGIDGNLFGSTTAEGDVLFPEDITNSSECATLLYEVCPESRRSEALEMLVEYALVALHGYAGDPDDYEAIPQWQAWLTKHEPRT